MKKAFTLIELLVVIAIIAILAAILFPVFAQAKEAAKKTQSLSNAKQIGTAVMIYITDYDDLFPMANNANWNAPTWAFAPVELPANWRSNNAAWVNVNSSVYPNNVYAYTKNNQIMEIAGARQDSTYASATPLASRVTAPYRAGWNLNGFLSSYSQTSISEVSRIPLLWAGMGKQNIEGYYIITPMLGCTGSTSTNCLFNPTALPTPVSLFGSTIGGSVFSTAYPNPAPQAIHSGGTVYVRSDSSAKFSKIGNPNTANNLTAVDAFSGYDAAGVGNAVTYCASSTTAPGYSCIFRPDFDFDYNNWF
ncbi:MAG: prepilin-type N-terminal cleavage/methylation domain-containing protein [Fimbriimonadaceae bacterium]|nr:prepilin-type N-terminal cleavage/methylation domain-containing protein [Fimbriimonadaceae bacterium]